MAVYDKATLTSNMKAVIKGNGTRNITGAILQGILEDMIDSLDLGASSTFDDADLDGNSSITINHLLGTTTPAVFVYDNNGELVKYINYDVVIIDSNQLSLTFPGSITGTWNYLIKK
jgi:hypothetical protein